MQLVEEQIGRKMTERELSEISRINDEGWPVSVLGPGMFEVMSLIKAAREYGERKKLIGEDTKVLNRNDIERNEQDEKVMEVKDLVSYLLKMPQNAELFFYAGHGGFLSLNTPEEISMYFKLSEDGNTLFLDHARYEAEAQERVAQGKEWSDLI